MNAPTDGLPLWSPPSKTAGQPIFIPFDQDQAAESDQPTPVTPADAWAAAVAPDLPVIDLHSDLDREREAVAEAIERLVTLRESIEREAAQLTDQRAELDHVRAELEEYRITLAAERANLIDQASELLEQRRELTQSCSDAA